MILKNSQVLETLAYRISSQPFCGTKVLCFLHACSFPSRIFTSLALYSQDVVNLEHIPGPAVPPAPAPHTPPSTLQLKPHLL